MKRTRVKDSRRATKEAPSRTRRPASREKARARVTPLSQRLEVPSRATPQDLFALAMRWWNEGERFDIGRMAQELGVSRATVFRWAGTRELLYGEVLSFRFEAALTAARSEFQGEGTAYVADVTQRLIHLIVEDAPLRRFIQQDSEYAMRVLMSKSSRVEERCAASIRRALEEGVRDKHLRPAMGLEALSNVIVRVGQFFLYRDALTGDPPDVQAAITATLILLTAEEGDARWNRR
ncbi:transcriptional regulator [Myxococcus sp. CA033]|uniref:QsdR family transcriptional regulator n=1 Tax=Myxococcus sp. CA033 TaxID=2741516 RepID=UPI00157B4615|nr:QsdR family transcriptional regulator [Myxococcus sp. CA033]NTX34287.1 transcriptional regulator [Myxococcus sp. CA033]